MKKLLLILFLGIILSSFSSALDVRETNLRTFRITVEFSEAVQITDESGNSISSTSMDADFPPYLSYNVDVEYSGDFSDVYFDNRNLLADGNYSFVFHYQKRNSVDQSIFPYPMRIEVKANEGSYPQLFDIELISPISGFHNESPVFNITLETSETSTCRYYRDDWRAYDSMLYNDIEDLSDARVHILEYPENAPKERIYWIGCRSIDDPSRESYKKFLFGWTDGISEIIAINQIPKPVVDESEKMADLTIDLEDYSICKANFFGEDGSDQFPSNNVMDGMLFNISQYYLSTTMKLCFTRDSSCQGLNIPDSYMVPGSEFNNYEIEITCNNRAHVYTSKKYNLSINYSNDPRLEYIRPNAFEKDGDIPFNLVSQINLDSCIYEITSEDIQGSYDSETSKNFTAEEELEEGTYTLISTCNAPVLDLPAQSSITFTVDSDAPSNFEFEVSPKVCQDEEFEINWTADDEVSGVDRFYYQIYYGEELVDEGSFSSHSRDLEIDGEVGDYTVNAYLVDNAGNPTRNETESFELLNDTDVFCDKIKPRVTIVENITSEGAEFKVNCIDDDSGCKTSFDYNLWVGSKLSNANCTFDKKGTLGKVYEVDKTSVLCYKVYDEAENFQEGKERISIEKEAEYCDDGIKNFDESDIDCGGSCPKCVVGDSCVGDTDCDADSFCNNKKVCELSNRCSTTDDCVSGSYCNSNGYCVEGISCKVQDDCVSGFLCNSDGFCEEITFECYLDSQCKYPKVCISGSCKDESDNSCRLDTDCAGYGEVCENNRCVIPSEKECDVDIDCPGYPEEVCSYNTCIEKQNPDGVGGFNWLAFAIAIFGVLLLGGGGYLYFVPQHESPKSSSLNLNKKPEIQLQKEKKLDYKDTKKVKELREKLSKQRPSSKRKTLLDAFDAKETVDKELPSGIEKTNKDLIPKLEKKDLDKKIIQEANKKISNLENKNSSKNPSTKKSSIKDEYVSLEKLNKKKKDVFDELEDL